MFCFFFLEIHKQIDRVRSISSTPGGGTPRARSINNKKSTEKTASNNDNASENNSGNSENGNESPEADVPMNNNAIEFCEALSGDSGITVALAAVTITNAIHDAAKTAAEIKEAEQESVELDLPTARELTSTASRTHSRLATMTSIATQAITGMGMGQLSKLNISDINLAIDDIKEEADDDGDGNGNGGGSGGNGDRDDDDDITSGGGDGEIMQANAKQGHIHSRTPSHLNSNYIAKAAIEMQMYTLYMTYEEFYGINKDYFVMFSCIDWYDLPLSDSIGLNIDNIEKQLKCIYKEYMVTGSINCINISSMSKNKIMAQVKKHFPNYTLNNENMVNDDFTSGFDMFGGAANALELSELKDNNSNNRSIDNDNNNNGDGNDSNDSNNNDRSSNNKNSSMLKPKTKSHMRVETHSPLPSMEMAKVADDAFKYASGDANPSDDESKNTNDNNNNKVKNSKHKNHKTEVNLVKASTMLMNDNNRNKELRKVFDWAVPDVISNLEGVFFRFKNSKQFIQIVLKTL